jgi:hypothetical protein
VWADDGLDPDPLRAERARATLLSPPHERPQGRTQLPRLPRIEVVVGTRGDDPGWSHWGELSLLPLVHKVRSLSVRFGWEEQPS